MAEDVVIRYRVEVANALKELKDLVDLNAKLGTSSSTAAVNIEKESAAVAKLEGELEQAKKFLKELLDQNKALAASGDQATQALAKETAIVATLETELAQAKTHLKELVEQNKQLVATAASSATAMDKEAKAADKLGKELVDTAKDADKAEKELVDAAKATDKLGKELTDAAKEAKKAGNELDKNVGGSLDDIGKKAVSFGKATALALGVAFSIDAVIQFGKASVNAFLAAEEEANRLRFAITKIGGESEVVFDRLIRQSERMEEMTVFSAGSIQQAQAALSAFGLTGDEIERLIPKLADFATITSQDIPSAAAQIGAALEGNGREFKKYGIEVSAAASRTENLNAILGGLDKFAGSAEEATKTLGGSLKQAENEANKLQTSLGEKLAPTLVSIRLGFLEFIKTLFDTKEALTLENETKQAESNAEKTVSTLRAAAAEIEKIYQIPPNEAYIKALEQQIAIEERIQEQASKSNLAKSVQEYNNATQALEILNAELLNFQNQLLASEAAQKALDARLLSTTELQKKSSEELVALAEKEKAIGDETSKKVLANIDKVVKAREKAAEEYKKQLEREAQELQKNLDRLEALRIANIDDARQKRIAEFEQEISDITAQGQLRADIIKELEIQLVKDLNEIDKQRNVDPLFRVPSNAPAVPDELENTRNPDSTVLDSEDIEDEHLKILNSTSTLLNDLSGLYATFNQIRLNEIEEQKNAQLEAIDIALNANEEALKKGRISQVEAAKVEQQLLAEKLAAEKKAADEERKIKRRQAILDKTAALFEIAINTAVNVAKYPPPNPLGYLAIASGAAQAAIVAAAPIPYRKGTKSAKGGLSLVDEEGAEAIFRPSQGRLTTLEKGTKVVPFKQTKTYSEAIDSMVDNKFEGFVLNRYVNPALKKAKKEKQQSDNVTFAENISKSFVLNNLGLTEKELEKVRRRGQSINNVDELARAISQYTKRDIYR